ncbi:MULTISPECIES: hypothetical protein [Providencia]|uniref:hypothetical protein n=1 Tax=Providencia TaxID=586 RepID=UPI0024802F73|nr:hypothetical protein [Providencia rettgeri]MDU7494296.1 hypothetical protein [Providencia rettgeri]
MSDLLHSTGYSFNQLQVQVRRSNQAEDHDMHVRIAKIESDISYIKRDISDIKDDLKELKKDAKIDFRLFFGSLIAVALGLAGLMAKGFGWL